MSSEPTIVRVDATYQPAVEVGDRVHAGDIISEAPEAQQCTAPLSGIVKSVRFDPETHEFVIAIVPMMRKSSPPRR